MYMIYELQINMLHMKKLGKLNLVLVGIECEILEILSKIEILFIFKILQGSFN